jgi:hypothetical protein
LLVALTRAPAATHYVDAASTNAAPPFTNWANASANIQDAVDAAAPGDEIVVTNGVYQTGARAVYGMSNRVAVTKAVTVRSVNGPAYTSIVGHGPIGENAIRCGYLTNGAVFAGFTLTNGATQFIGDSEMDSITNSGGGVWCESQSALITNCVLAGNTASSEGGGAYSGTLHNCIVTRNYAWYAGGGAAQSTLHNCTLPNNSASIFGGAAIGSALVHCTLTGNGAEIGGGGAYSSRLTNCTVMSNSVYSIVTAFNYGGGVASSTLENCLVMGNSAWDENGVGGGAHASTLNNCTLRGNLARGGAGAILSTLNNCLVVENLAASDGCGGGAASSTLNNCTLSGNSASYGGGCCSSTLNNCIVYDNTARASGDNYTTGTFNYSCTTPAPGSGVGNITNAPLFMDTNGWSNLRLQSNSPCINAGNNASVVGYTDLDGHARIAGSAVDIGAFEWQGTTRYVSAASTNPIAPYSSWASAALTIQDAVDAAAPGDEIVVTNGVYQTGARAVYGMSNRVAVTKAVTVRSVNGPAYTSIVGRGPIGENAIRCVYLTNGAVLAGFTLTNGATQDDGDPEIDSVSNSGGGVWCETRGAVVTSCVLAGNSAFSYGGGAFGNTLNNCTLTGNSAPYGAGTAGSTLNDSTLTNNSAEIGGGAWECVLKNCTLTGNRAEIGGGGAHSSRLTNCTVTSNSVYSITTAFNYGGGVASSTLENCLVMGNSAWDENGVGGGAHASTLNNCTLRGNFAHGGAGAILSTLNNCLVLENLAASDGCGGGAALSTLNNCTLSGNSASYGGGCCSSTLNNCIVYDNTARASGDNYTTGTFNYSCTTPAPASGVGNITNAPLLVDTNGWSNLRLQSNSPCINAGNNAYVTVATDLDGLPRIAGGTVDIGAYEFQSPASTISYAWLQQSGLPTDGSADDADTDHDGLNNWQEWMAGTDPTNALSALRLAPPVITPTNVTLTWTSVTNRTYTLEQATNLGGAPAFSVLRSNLVGLPGTTSWTDTNAPVSSPRFYRLRVSP